MEADDYLTSPSDSADLVRDLRGVGLCEGDGVFVHASFRSLGHVDGGPQCVIKSILDVVGPNGLVAMPGFSSYAMLPKEFNSLSDEQRTAALEETLPFRRLTTATSGMGAIAESYRSYPGTVRSTHPILSVCAIGPDAGSLVAKHSLDFATGPGTPFGAFIERPAMKILLLGVDWTRCSALHTAETLAKPRRVKQYCFRLGAHWHVARDVADDNGRVFPRVGKAFESLGRVKQGAVGCATAKPNWFRLHHRRFRASMNESNQMISRETADVWLASVEVQAD